MIRRSFEIHNERLPLDENKAGGMSVWKRTRKQTRISIACLDKIQALLTSIFYADENSFFF